MKKSVISINIVINIPKDKLNELTRYLQSHKIENKNQYILTSAKKEGVSYSLFSTGRLVMQGNNEESLKKEKQTILNLVYAENKELVLGFDETGRSEHTGPFVICGVLGFEKDLSSLRDSKKTTNISEAKKEVDRNSLANLTLVLNPEFIDCLRTQGTNLNDMEYFFIKNANKFFKELNQDCKTIVDGNPLNSQKADWEYMPKADDKICTVSAASIVAKDIRDKSGNKNKRKTWNVK